MRHHFLAAITWCSSGLLLLSCDSDWYLLVMVAVIRASNNSHVAPLSYIDRAA